MRLGSEHPNAEVYGVDLTPVPKMHEKPDNVQFITEEIWKLIREGTAGFEPGTFSYIFSRMVFLGITDWPAYFKALYDLLEPGGWVESQEVDFTFRDVSDEVISQDWKWLSLMKKAVSKNGLDLDCATKFEGMMEAVGFVDVQVRKYCWSYSLEHWEEHPESDEIGRYSNRLLKGDMQRMAPRLYEGLGVGEAEIMELSANMVETIDGLPKGSHTRYYAVSGRKPS